MRKRPHLDYFLNTVAKKFEVIVFTASQVAAAAAAAAAAVVALALALTERAGGERVVSGAEQCWAVLSGLAG